MCSESYNLSVPNKNRKVIRKDLWARNVRQTNRARDYPYTDRNGQEKRRGRESNCDCKYRCHERVRDVSTVQRMFNGMGTKALQDVYIAGCIKSHPVQRQRPSTGERTHRAYANSYYVKIGLHRHRVCQKAFAAIHTISLRRVALIAKKSALNMSLEEQRGKHANRPNKIKDEVVQRVHNHILKFPTEPSHYSRADNQDVQYLPANLTLKTMHELFTAENPDDGIFMIFTAGISLQISTFDFASPNQIHAKLAMCSPPN